MRRLLWVVVLFAALEAHAQTWLADPVSANWSDAANWNPAIVPNGLVTAIFATSVTPTIHVDGGFGVNSAEFSDDGFRFEIATGNSLAFVGAGVVNTGGSEPTFHVTGGALYFANFATAGISTIILDKGALVS